MTIKPEFQRKFDYFVKRGSGMSHAPLGKSLCDPSGKSAVESFLAYESTGEMPPTREPEQLALALCGKKSHAITVNQKAESWFEGTYLRFDLEAEVDWVQRDILGAVNRMRKERAHK